jgi:hypothetical protein
MHYTQIFDRLWSTYIHLNPTVKQVYQAFTELGEHIENDHIAIRTFFHPKVNVDVLARPFVQAGYVQKGFYVFEDKHLTAKHFEHQGDPKAPKVFISQLMLSSFSGAFQNFINKLIDELPDSLFFDDELVFAGNIWGKPNYVQYQKLRLESEYAAWLYAFGYMANHFTVNINALKSMSTVEEVNAFLKAKGFVLNDSGGEIKGTPAQLLQQSSVKAGLSILEFEEGKYEIPSCYYEFAKRYTDLQGGLYHGFIAKSADKIFESTDFHR